MNRQQKITELMARGADDVRRLALDELDDSARRENTFGSKEHRDARERVEKRYDSAQRAFEGLSDAQLDERLAAGAEA